MAHLKRSPANTAATIGVPACGRALLSLGSCKGYSMRALCAAIVAVSALGGASAGAAEPALEPGLYLVEVRISLPNVQDTAPPLFVQRCIGPSDLGSGQAFAVLSDNPLKVCALVDYAATADSAVYRIVCPGPNRGSAVGAFETTATTYRGSIKMNMGGKNMTMSEVQAAKRVGECP
jgi:hypothetical protein